MSNQEQCPYLIWDTHEILNNQAKYLVENGEADNGKSFLSHILPNTECMFRVFIDDDKTIRIQNFHHDSPTGNEWYTITIDKDALNEAA